MTELGPANTSLSPAPARRSCSHLDLFGLADRTLVVDIGDIDGGVALVTVDAAADPQAQALLGQLKAVTVTSEVRAGHRG